MRAISGLCPAKKRAGVTLWWMTPFFPGSPRRAWVSGEGRAKWRMVRSPDAGRGNSEKRRLSPSSPRSRDRQ